MKIFKGIPILKKAVDIVSTVILVAVLSALVGLVLAFPVMWLWNFVFGSLYRLNVFQAWALNVLAGILFGHIANKRNVQE